MPQYSPAHGENELPEKWYLKPIGKRGIWGIRKFLPFLSGDVLALELIIESDSNTSRKYEFSCVLIQRLPDTSEEQIDSELRLITVNKGTTKVPLKTHLLQYEGEYRLFTQMNISGQAKPHLQTLANFKALARDVFYVDLGKLLAAGLIGGIIGLLVGLLLPS
jgi:hypothetical protein